jgi:hypothetical protein
MDREVEFREIQKALEKHRKGMEEANGIDEEWERVDEIVGRVCQVIDWLDDLVWNAMVDPAVVVEKFRSDQLAFQAGAS